MARTIAVANQKGGVAKTSSVANLGAALARKGARVLLVDYDPQCSLTEALEHPEAGEGEIVALGGYDLMCGDPALVTHAFKGLGELDAILEPKRGRYDYIIVDCPPSLGPVAMAGIYAADEVIVATQPSFLAARGIAEAWDTIRYVAGKGGHAGRARVLFTIVERNGAAREMIEQVGEGYPTFATQIRKGVAIPYSQAAGVDVFAYDPRSGVAADYAALADEIMSAVD